MPRSKDGRWTRNCEVCGEPFHQLRKNQRTCPLPKPCRARLPHNTGGSRAKAGLAPRACQNPGCAQMFVPVRENQIACSRTCLLACPSYIESQHRSDNRPERRRRQNQRRRLDSCDDEAARYIERHRQAGCQEPGSPSPALAACPQTEGH